MAKIKIQPLDDRIIVEPIEAEPVTAGGIVLPDAAKERPQQGKVLAVGPGRLLNTGDRAKVAIEVGDLVLFGQYGGLDIDVEGDELKVLREEDVLGIMCALPGEPATPFPRPPKKSPDSPATLPGDPATPFPGGKGMLPGESGTPFPISGGDKKKGKKRKR